MEFMKKNYSLHPFWVKCNHVAGRKVEDLIYVNTHLYHFRVFVQVFFRTHT